MFYTYNQNNSGGSFDSDDKIAQFVIVEAKSPRVADALAEDLGIYFNGCHDGRDCDCCGDRWSPAYDGKEEPAIYGKPIAEYEADFCKKGEVYARVFYLDGTVTEYRNEKKGKFR